MYKYSHIYRYEREGVCEYRLSLLLLLLQNIIVPESIGFIFFFIVSKTVFTSALYICYDFGIDAIIGK